MKWLLQRLGVPPCEVAFRSQSSGTDHAWRRP